MKKLFKKNQFVVTMLAILIAVAGYLNYADKIAKRDVEQQTTGTYEAMYGEDDLISSEEDILSMDVDIADMENATLEEETTVEGENVANVENYEEETYEPGEAVLTSGSTPSSFTIDARVNREQIRSKNKETLLEIIDNETLTDDEKQVAVDEMVNLTKLSELENNIETLLEAKGFKDVVVTLSDEQADIIVDTSQISDSDRAQIEDIITRKTELSITDIVIVPKEAS